MVFLSSVGDIYVCSRMTRTGGRCLSLNGYFADVFFGCDLGGNSTSSVAFGFYDAFLRYRGNGFVGGPPFDFFRVVS